jgi:hypothetical protein
MKAGKSCLKTDGQAGPGAESHRGRSTHRSVRFHDEARCVVSGAVVQPHARGRAQWIAKEFANSNLVAATHTRWVDARTVGSLLFRGLRAKKLGARAPDPENVNFAHLFTCAALHRQMNKRISGPPILDRRYRRYHPAILKIPECEWLPFYLRIARLRHPPPPPPTKPLYLPR